MRARSSLHALCLLALVVASACGDKDRGLADAGGDPTSCEAKVCGDPPPAACVDDHTLGSFEPTGTCDRGQCAYREQLIPCAQGCTTGACIGEPCAGVHCATPPAPTCLDGGVLKSYDPSGTCDAGACTYTAHETTCAQGCAAGACVGDPCAGVTCDTPPASSCASPDDLRTYASPGTCAGGTCAYTASTITCGFGCAAGACAGDPCAGVACTTPPAAYCKDSVTRKSFAPTGTCAGGGCTYAPTETVCEFGCAAGACNDDPCTGVTCASPPADVCVNGALRTWSDTGTCGGGACSYGYVDNPCPNGCVGNACVGVSCGGGTCDKPPADTCKDVSHATIHAPLGTCAASKCGYQANDVYCSNGCLNGACLPGSWTLELNPLTQGTIPYDGNGRMLIDAAGHPREVVCDEYDRLDYNEYNLYGWVQTIVDSGFASGCDKALALGAGGAVYIAYGDPVNDILRFAERAPGATTFTLSVITTTKYTNTAISMTVDAAGNPVVAYLEGVSQKARVATRKAGVWSFEDAIGSAIGVGDRTVIRFAPDGALHVLAGTDYLPSSTSIPGPIGHAVRAGGVWTAVTIAPSGLIGTRSLGIAPSGAPYYLFATKPTQFSLDLVAVLPGAGPVQALKTGGIDRAYLPLLAYDWIGDDLKLARVGGTISGPTTVGGAARQNGGWSDYQPVIDYDVCDGETGPDGRTRFLASQSWALITAPACVPACAFRTCGSDGCGGSCGTCATGKSCSTAGTCQ